MQLPFLKMHGTGNQIVIVDQRHDGRAPPSCAAVKALGQRKAGPGFDQLMWVGPPKAPGMAASYRVFNADGSEAEQCGNGVRCVVWMLAREAGAGVDFMLESPVGPIETRVLEDRSIAVNMGSPEFDPPRIPFLADAQQLGYRLEVCEQTIGVAVLSMGNPHCVLEVDAVDTADVANLGPAIEHHQRFPARTNVEFMHIVDRANINLRVHERGVGETQACGTGACAAVVAGRQRDLLDPEVTVRLPGGELMVSWRGGNEPVWLIGNAELVSEGTIDL